jgi:type VI protein secretion system component VasK
MQQPSTQPPPPADKPQQRRVRGKDLLVVIVIAMAVYTAAKFISGDFLDTDQERRRAERAERLALDARQAWNDYSMEAGLELHTTAADALHGGEDLMAASQYEAARTAFQRAHERYMAAFSEHAEEVAELWQTGVLEPAEARVWPHYPFQADAETEADVALVTELFNPVNGAVWQIEAVARRLNAVEIQNLRVARITIDREWLERARFVRDALFGSSGEPDVRFEVVLDAPDWRLTVDGEATPARVRWTGAVHSVALHGPQEISATSPWAWFRVLDALEHAGPAEGRYRFVLPGGGTLTVVPERAEHPFRRPRGL